MGLLDWLIVLVPLGFVLYMGWRSSRYIRGVADFLAAGRICGRYTICVADAANGLALSGLVSLIEARYKTGFAVFFWSGVLMPLGLIMALTGYCTYRWRETKAMSLGQFLEMRYSRSVRIFAAALRTVSEMLCNMIGPAIAARFFIYYLGLPPAVCICGCRVSTFLLVIVLVLILSIWIIWLGGTLALVITDTIQGLFCFPMVVVFCVFVLLKFSWFQEIVPVMMDRAPGESFLNPYEIENLRDFNLLAMLVVPAVSLVLHRASWIGAGNDGAGKSPHEQKMAGVLGTWRNGLSSVFYMLFPVMILTILNHRDFAPEARSIRTEISERISGEMIADRAERDRFMADIRAIPEQRHVIGRDPALSQERNLDTVYLDTALRNLNAADPSRDKAASNARFQEFRSLFNQLMLPVTMRRLLPAGLAGLFCLMMILMMISTDDSRIYSSALTLTQDVVMPLRRRPFTPAGHIRMIRAVSVCVGLFFLCGSYFMAQLDYIQLYGTIMCSMWLGGCGPVMIFGLYSRFGTAAGAWASLLSGLSLSLGGVLVQRNWADHVYPWLLRHDWVGSAGDLLAAVSRPFNPYVVWRMNPFKCPVNSYELYFLVMVVSLALYCAVSLLTCRRPFNLDRLLHRGIYDLDGEDKTRERPTLRNVFSRLLGITPEYTRGDRFIAWSVFLYSFVYSFLGSFVLVVVLNAVSPWPLRWWGYYFLVVFLVVPGAMAAVSAVWFTVGGVVDLRRMFAALKQRIGNPLDDGWVEGHTSRADSAAFAEKEGRPAPGTEDGP